MYIVSATLLTKWNPKSMLNNEFADGFRIGSIIDYDIDMISTNWGLSYLPETTDCYLQKKFNESEGCKVSYTKLCNTSTTLIACIF